MSTAYRAKGDMLKSLPQRLANVPCRPVSQRCRDRQFSAYSHPALELHHWMAMFASSPAVVSGVVYVGEDNNVYALGGSPTSSSSSTSSSALFIIIGSVVAVVIVAAVVFLMFQNRLKNKPTSPPPPPQNYFRKAVDNLFD